MTSQILGGCSNHMESKVIYLRSYNTVSLVSNYFQRGGGENIQDLKKVLSGHPGRADLSAWQVGFHFNLLMGKDPGRLSAN